MPVSIIDYKAFDSDSSTYSESDIHNWLNNVEDEGYLAYSYSGYLNKYTENKDYREIYNCSKYEEITSGSATAVTTSSAIYIANKIDNIPSNYYNFASNTINCKVFLPGIEEINKAYKLDSDFYKAWKTVEDYKAKNTESGIASYWLSTPYNAKGENDKVSVISSTETVGSAQVNDASVGFRPVVSIKNINDKRIVGEGTLDLPYVIVQDTSSSSSYYEDFSDSRFSYHEDFSDSRFSFISRDGNNDSDIMLGDVSSKRVAEDFIYQELAKFSDEEKKENVYLLTVLADEAVARAANISVDTTQLEIDDIMIEDAARVANRTAKSITNIYKSEGVPLQRSIKKSVRIVDNLNARISIKKGISKNNLQIDNLIVSTPFGSVIIDPEKTYDFSIAKKSDVKESENEERLQKSNEESLKNLYSALTIDNSSVSLLAANNRKTRKSSSSEDETETTTYSLSEKSTETTTESQKKYYTDNSVEKELVKKGTSVYSDRKQVYNEIDHIFADTSKQNCQRIEVKFNKPSSNEIVKVRFFGIEDGEYKAVINEDGLPLGGRYNVITGELSAPVSKSGIFSYADNEQKFEDIKSESAELREAVLTLASKGIIYGTAEGEYSPDKNITRAEVAAVMLRMILGSDGIDPNEDGKFVDVPKDSWYFGIAGTSKREHLIDGYSDNTFRGNVVIPFEDIVSVLGRTLERETYMISDSSENIIKAKYDNFNDVSNWVRNELALAIECSVVTLPENRTYDGEEEMTRGDAAVSVYNVYKMLAD